MELAGTVEPQIGDVGDGVIDGTTSEGGYLVTMKFGSQVLKGVLYHHAKRPQQAMGTPPSGMPPASQRRAKKKARETTQVDSKKPKFRRSGYKPKKQIGDVGDGVIDGTTSEGGYLVTMKFGSQVLKGVLYHHAKRPQQAMGTPPSGMPPASQRRAKKKARETTQVDSKKPKFRRSGYKPKKQVYQDKGVTDGERYRTEIMLEYESAHESDGASASAAATMAQ
ncbi:unnamed protein product [Brassica rapa]|uniref:Uncharacterized protein n=1 Tax=Brassica campestris TaxID=3711 RepID=A0A8D9DQZ5_BRACM|nr:unnamed protein product [Brassica rapa]